MTTPDPLPEVHLLYNPKRWVCLPASFAEPKYLEAEIEIGMVFIKTRKPNYKSANNVGEVGNIIIFPFYWCSTKGVHYWGGGTPTEGNFSFEKWFEQFGKNYRIPVEVVPVEVAVADQEPEKTGHTQQTQADHQHAGDGAAAESHIECRANALGGGLRRAHVGAHRDVHADEATSAREHRTNHKADGAQLIEKDGDQNSQHDANNGDGFVLPRQVGGSTGLNGGCNFLHARVTGIL